MPRLICPGRSVIRLTQRLPHSSGTDALAWLPKPKGSNQALSAACFSNPNHFLKGEPSMGRVFGSDDEHVIKIQIASQDDEGNVLPGGPISDIRIQRTETSVRVVMDPWGEDHDVLIEQHADKWIIMVHPMGQDPACIIEVNMKKAVVMDDLGNVLLTQDMT